MPMLQLDVLKNHDFISVENSRTTCGGGGWHRGAELECACRAGTMSVVPWASQIKGFLLCTPKHIGHR